MPTYPANIDLSDLNGSNGFRLLGVNAGDNTGYSVAAAGDVNGDGFEDLIIGAPRASGGGVSYVVFGQAGGFAADFDLSTLDGTNGFKLHAPPNVSLVGLTVASAGDINGDGFADVAVGGISTAFLVYGKASGFAADVNLTKVGGGGTTSFLGTGSAAFAVASAGDVNGDGIDDFIIGAPYASPHGTKSGISYVVFGSHSGLGNSFALSSLNGSNGFTISGAVAVDQTGHSVASAGDINHDGFDDIMVGAPFADPNGTNSGATYVIYGSSTGFSSNIDVTSLDGTNGFKISGQQAADENGWSVASAGDVNGDGYADMIVGIRATQSPASSSYVIFGTASGFAADVDLSTLDGTNGFRIDGELGARLGTSVASAGDVNGDGYADIIVGAPLAGSGDPGASYVVFGKASGFSAVLDVSTLDGSNGFSITGTVPSNHSSDDSGFSVSAADINDDGFSDLIVGAPYAEPAGASSLANNGAAYVVYGIAPDTAVTLDGTLASQTLAGGDFDDVLNGHRGDDVLHGNGGADTLVGGDGNDTLLGGAGNDTLRGGDGNDTLVGGAGRDNLVGGAGQDTFVFKLATDSGVGGPNRDQIADFQQGVDHIDLSAIDANSTTSAANDAFTFVGTASFSHHAGELRQFQNPAGNTIVAGDVNGDGVADFEITVVGSIALTHNDFVL